MNDMLYIAAKGPRAGYAKTRLGQAIGHEFAISLYRAFLMDLAARFSNAYFAFGWYVTPPDAWTDIAPLVGRKGRAARVSIQGEGDWTGRQRQLFREATGRGEERVVLIASDSPHITIEAVDRAFRELDRHDLVLGPTFDGGYYLIGMRGFQDVFRGVPMSTTTVLNDILARAADLRLSVGWVEATFDVDQAEDLEYLRRLVATRPDLAATRAALETLDTHLNRRRHAVSEPDQPRTTAADRVAGSAPGCSWKS